MAKYRIISSKGKKAAGREGTTVRRETAAVRESAAGRAAVAAREGAAMGASSVDRGGVATVRESAAGRENTTVRRSSATRENSAGRGGSAAGRAKPVSRDKPVKRKKAKRVTAGKTVAVISLILVVGIVAFFISLGFYVDSLETIYPNVWADGTNLSGMTLEEAGLTLIGIGYESNADGVSATIVFPDDSSFTVNGEEAGFSLDSGEAARAAYEFGRDGTFFENELAYIRAYITRTDLRDVSVAVFNEEYVREAAATHTKAFNDTLMADAYTIDHYSITIAKGITFSPADENEVIELAVKTLYQALSEKTHLTVRYEPEASVIKEIDIGMLYDSIYVEPISSEYDPDSFTATKSASGLSFDLSAAIDKLEKAGMGEKIVIPLITVQPKVKEDDINSLLFRDILAESTTYISGNSNRLNNVVLSAGFIDGTVLNPGDIFSFNGIVGPRTAARGFKEAGAYANNLLVTEIGGGICQTSSTIYVSVLKTDLEVLERRPHMMTVGYLPLGSDATIDWGTIDLKFKNNTDYPVKIEVTIDGRNITVRLIGTKLDDNYYKIDYTLISSTPIEVIMREDETIPQGETKVYSEGSTGYVVDTYKHLYDADDNLISTTLVGRSVYSVQHRVILVPPELPEDPDADPDGTGVDPDGTDIDPDGTGTDPDGTDIDPDGTGTDPDGTDIDPDGAGTDPDGTYIDPDGTGTGSGGTNSDPDGAGTDPDSTGVDPDGTRTEPDGTDVNTSVDPDHNTGGADSDPDGAGGLAENQNDLPETDPAPPLEESPPPETPPDDQITEG